MNIEKKCKTNKEVALSLRDMLLKDLKRFRKGKIGYKDAQGVCRFSDSIMRTMSE